MAYALHIARIISILCVSVFICALLYRKFGYKAERFTQCTDNKCADGQFTHIYKSETGTEHVFCGDSNKYIDVTGSTPELKSCPSDGYVDSDGDVTQHKVYYTSSSNIEQCKSNCTSGSEYGVNYNIVNSGYACTNAWIENQVVVGSTKYILKNEPIESDNTAEYSLPTDVNIFSTTIDCHDTYRDTCKTYAHAPGTLNLQDLVSTNVYYYDKTPKTSFGEGHKYLDKTTESVTDIPSSTRASVPDLNIVVAGKRGSNYIELSTYSNDTEGYSYCTGFSDDVAVKTRMTYSSDNTPLYPTSIDFVLPAEITNDSNQCKIDCKAGIYHHEEEVRYNTNYDEGDGTIVPLGAIANYASGGDSIEIKNHTFNCKSTNKSILLNEFDDNMWTWKVFDHTLLGNEPGDGDISTPNITNLFTAVCSSNNSNNCWSNGDPPAYILRTDTNFESSMLNTVEAGTKIYECKTANTYLRMNNNNPPNFKCCGPNQILSDRDNPTCETTPDESTMQNYNLKFSTDNIFSSTNLRLYYDSKKMRFGLKYINTIPTLTADEIAEIGDKRINIANAKISYCEYSSTASGEHIYEFKDGVSTQASFKINNLSITCMKEDESDANLITSIETDHDVARQLYNLVKTIFNDTCKQTVPLELSQRLDNTSLPLFDVLSLQIDDDIGELEVTTDSGNIGLEANDDFMALICKCEPFQYTTPTNKCATCSMPFGQQLAQGAIVSDEKYAPSDGSATCQSCRLGNNMYAYYEKIEGRTVLKAHGIADSIREFHDSNPTLLQGEQLIDCAERSASTSDYCTKELYYEIDARCACESNYTKITNDFVPVSSGSAPTGLEPSRNRCVNLNACMTPEDSYDIVSQKCLPTKIKNIEADIYIKTNPWSRVLNKSSITSHRSLDFLKKQMLYEGSHLTEDKFDIFDKNGDVVMCENYDPIIHNGCVNITKYDQYVDIGNEAIDNNCIGIEGNLTIPFVANDGTLDPENYKQCIKNCTALGGTDIGIGQCSYSECDGSNMAKSSGSYYQLPLGSESVCLPCSNDICKVSGGEADIITSVITLNNTEKYYLSQNPCKENGYTYYNDDGENVMLTFQKEIDGEQSTDYNCYYNTIVPNVELMDQLGTVNTVSEMKNLVLCDKGEYYDTSDKNCKTCLPGMYQPSEMVGQGPFAGNKFDCMYPPQGYIAKSTSNNGYYDTIQLDNIGNTVDTWKGCKHSEIIPARTLEYLERDNPNEKKTEIISGTTSVNYECKTEGDKCRPISRGIHDGPRCLSDADIAYVCSKMENNKFKYVYDTDNGCTPIKKEKKKKRKGR